MIHILCKNITQRHRYTFNVVFHHWLNTEYRIITSDEDNEPSGGALIVYDNTHRQPGIFIPCSGLLDESTIRNLVPEYSSWLGKPIIFPSGEDFVTMPFDIFSAIFYMISRYEEYLPYTPDEHGRFEVHMSLAGIRRFQHIPVVDYWVKELRLIINRQYPGMIAEPPAFSFLPTYDIDQFRSYLYKGFLRNSAGYIRDLFKGKSRELKTRLNVLRKKEKDPFDSFDYQDALHKKYDLKPLYFIHPGTWGTFDKNLPLRKPEAAEMVRTLAKSYSIGLHPSYRSTENPELLKKEIADLSSVINAPVTCCRQHFLRIRIPETYRNFINCGIKNDYSLGWATDNGFRAGTGRSFPFYDLEKEQQTSLILHPLSMMDGAFKNYLKLSPTASVKEAMKLIDALKETDSSCICLFHNESLGTSPQWEGWKEVYEYIIEKSR